jgi:hypothetical protein
MEYKVIECLGNTGLGDYNEKNGENPKPFRLD